MPAATPSSALRHLRARGEEGAGRTTMVELFFDLVYVFAITQLAELILDDLTATGIAQATFLLVVIWWAWIYTTWMANWFDPDSPAVRSLLTAVMLASLLMAAALPDAFGDQAVLFAASYVALQVGRNGAALSLLVRDHPLRDVFERLLPWSVASGALWLLGATLEPDLRLVAWVAALAFELMAPLTGYWLPGRGRTSTTDWDIDGGHFAERCQLFIIIALGESIVVTGASATHAGLTPIAVLCLGVAFLQTVALWWLYFGTPTRESHTAMSLSDDPGRVARDAYTYLHLPIVAGIIASAAAEELLISAPHDPQHGVGAAVVLGGPALFLVGQSLFQWRTVATISPVRLAAAGLLVALMPMAPEVSTLALSLVVTAVLVAVAFGERHAPFLQGQAAAQATGESDWPAGGFEGKAVAGSSRHDKWLPTPQVVAASPTEKRK